MLDSEILVERYEHLRQEVLSTGIGSRLGISVLLRQGLVAGLGGLDTSAGVAHPHRHACACPFSPGAAPSAPGPGR